MRLLLKNMRSLYITRIILCSLPIIQSRNPPRNKKERNYIPSRPQINISNPIHEDTQNPTLHLPHFQHQATSHLLLLTLTNNHNTRLNLRHRRRLALVDRGMLRRSRSRRAGRRGDNSRGGDSRRRRRRHDNRRRDSLRLRLGLLFVFLLVLMLVVPAPARRRAAGDAEVPGRIGVCLAAAAAFFLGGAVVTLEEV
jgi:hypothetical protein